MVVLDIAIGLVLIYFLYSLLSSIIAEIISSWIGMRARMLKQGIDNILNDKQIGSGQDFKKWLQDIFLVEDNNFRYTNAGKFYEEPTIKYLAKPGEQTLYSLRNRKPAYISPETFVITVLNMFSNKGRGISEWDKIKFAIETNAIHLEPETLKMFQDMVKRSNDSYKNFVDLLLHHFADTMDRVNGWYKRKIGMIIFYIGLFLCTIFNVDSFQIIKTLSENKEKRLQMVELAERVIDKKAKIDTLMSVKDSLEEMKYKMQAHAIVKGAVLEANDIMATGWDFKIGPRKEATCISNDPTCWSCITESQAKYVEDRVKLSKGKREKITGLQQQIKDNQLLVSVIKIKLDSISFLKNEIKQLTESIHDSIGLSYIEYDTTYRKNHVLWIEGPGYPSIAEKGTVILSKMSLFQSKFWGIILTALALTLGAQFWFDLLKKLVSIRSSGVKPEESEEKKRQITQLKLEGEKVTSNDPVEIAISENRAYWESLPGFIGYNIMNDDNDVRYIEVSLDKEVRKIAPVYNKVSVVLPDGLNVVDIVVKYKLFGKAKFENDSFNFRGAIKQSDTGAIGTPAGIVRNNRTGKQAILTCGHVARIDKSTFISNEKSKVYFFNGKDWNSEIGVTSNIVMSSFCDGGVIDITNIQHGLNLKFIKEFRKIDTLLKSEEYKLHSVRGLKEIKLYDKNFYTTIKDSGGTFDLRMLQLLVFESKSKDDYSLPGDSGSLVTDKNDCPIGIHIGGYESSTTKFCYVVKMQDLMEILQISPIQNI